MRCGNALKTCGLEPEHESADEIYDDWYVHSVPLSAVRSPVDRGGVRSVCQPTVENRQYWADCLGANIGRLESACAHLPRCHNTGQG